MRTSLALRRVLALIALCVLPSALLAQDFHLERLRTEYRENPIGIDVRVPRFSWQLHATRRNTTQSAYEIRVAADSSSLGRAPTWSSGRVTSDESIFRAYAGPPLRSTTRYWWQVRAWDDAGHTSPWSTPAFFETGLFERGDWTAQWITPDLAEDTTRANPSPMLRRDFSLDGRIASARLYVTSLGLNLVEINGRRVTDHLFTPGWTSYAKRLQYDTYDVTPLLTSGANAVGVTLGDGWYRGHLGFRGKRNNYGTRLGILAQLVVRYADGRAQTIGTDTQWKSATGPIRLSDIYDGETYDARLERTGWSSARYDDHEWRGVRVLEGVTAQLVAPVGPPVRRTQEITPVKIIHTPTGETVFDLGQNMVGWVRLKVRGPAGSTVRLRHAEVLDKAGNMYTANLRGARAEVQYTLRGGSEETFEPHFTFQGFRYVAVDGYPGTPSLDAVTGVVIHSDMERTGSFASSNTLVNQLQHNILWGERGNFLDVPTDCPQRDERLGWTGDAQVFSRTAAFNMDVNGFFAKWLADLALDQKSDGSMPSVIPDVLSRTSASVGGSAGWADASVIVPWNVYQAYGDARLLERQYPSMRAWVDYVHKQAGDKLLWNTGSHYGDWLAFATTRSDYPGATTDKDLIATAYFAHSSDLVSRAAAALGNTDDARTYRDLFERIRAAFQREFVSASGRLASNTQTAYVLALDFDLLPESMRAESARRLAADVAVMKHLTTGFLGTPALTRTLSDNGYLDAAYKLLLNEQYPSWLYPVKHGATTIWERWDGQKPDGSFQDAGMNSFNHYAYGAVGDWMYRTVAGLDADQAVPAFRHLLIHPQPGGGFTAARATLMTPYGEAASGWSVAGDSVHVTVRVPANARATVRLPGGAVKDVGSGDYEWTVARP